MNQPLAHLGQILRPDDGTAAAHSRSALLGLAAVLVVCGLAYGAVMGTFGGVGVDRLEQIAYSAVKVPVLLGVTFAICLPSFFVLNTLLGVRNDFASVLRALVAAQAGLALILASLAPYTALWYLSFEHYQIAIFFNGVMFAIASIMAQLIVRRLYRPLINRDPRHRTLIRIWLAMYIAVGIQTAWVLRPFVGHPNLPTEFFREDSWTNAYVAIAHMIWQILGE